MATVAEFTVAADEFPLGTIFEPLPDVRVELDRVVPTESSIIPYFWVTGANVDDIVTNFSAHPGVRSVRSVDSFAEEYLLRCEWPSEYAGIMSGLTTAEVALLTAVGTAVEWRFEVRGDTREAIAEFQQYCEEAGIPITVVSVHALTPLTVDQQLTDTQEEALLLAYDWGYYDTPRTTTLTELGDDLGISQQALGSRLRRGTRHLIANTLANGRSSARQKS